jgi:probable selenium-dependent hydroxylase accessory protein YqeC
MRLGGYFDRFPRHVVSIIGCGGKTSLMRHLAKNRRKQKTLVTTTTHTQLPQAADGLFDRLLVTPPFEAPLDPPVGITLAGTLREGGNSLASLPPDTLESLIPHFDNVYIEADGSRTLPLKGWAAHEPVITASTTLTVGILPLWPLGKAVSEGLVHRLSLFTAITGAAAGVAVTHAHYAALIAGQPERADSARLAGAHTLFAISKGGLVLFFNQVEDDRTMDSARELAAMLPGAFRARRDGIIAGSIQRDYVEAL